MSAAASGNDNSSSSSLTIPVIAGLAVGILLVALLSRAFAVKGIQNNTEPQVLNDKVPKIKLGIIACIDSSNLKLSTNPQDNPVVLRRIGTSDEVTIPLCIIS